MALRGEAGWEAACSQEFGADRWPLLRPALQRDAEHVCFGNPFLPPEALQVLKEEYCMQETHIPGAYSFDVPEDPAVQYSVMEHAEDSVIFVEAERGSRLSRPPDPEAPPSAGLTPFFFAEGAAVIAAKALQPEEGERVLDACAAPGGKALVLAAAMFSAGITSGREVRGRLVCNEVSKERAARMQRSMRAFLPHALFDEGRPYGPHVIFTSADVGTPVNTMEKNAPYDKILFDAPGTVDRDLLRSDGKLERWSTGTIKTSAERQLKLLRNLLWLLKEGGVLLFCSCALAAAETDRVVERLVVQERNNFELDVLQLEEEVCRMVPNLAAEPTDYGVRVLPDVAHFGPLYFSRLRLVRRSHPDVRHLPD